MVSIHQTAIVSPHAQLGSDIKIGPYCIVGDHVELGDRSVLRSHVVLEGPSQIGRENEFYAHTMIGVAPQDLKYSGEPTTLVMGDHNIVREYASIHRGTVKGGGQTKIGSNNLIMGYVHVAHDCQIGNHNIIANAVQLSGHVVVDDHVNIGGQSGVVQFIRLGSYAYIGGATVVDQNIPPFAMGYGNRIVVKGVNVIGLERNGVSRQDVAAISSMHKEFLRSSDDWQVVVATLEEKYSHCHTAMLYLQFVKEVQGNIKRKHRSRKRSS